MRPTQPNDSPAIRVLRAVWDGASRPITSWRAFNSAMSSALTLAVQTGTQFREGDLSIIASELGSGHWLGAEGFGGLYGLAIRSGNRSCWKEIERHTQILPYIFQGKRLYVGCEFSWQGMVVKCTSMTNNHLIACTYKHIHIPGHCAFCNPQGRTKPVVDRKIKITRSELASANKNLNATKSESRHELRRDTL